MASFRLTFVRVQNRSGNGLEQPAPQGRGALRCTTLTTGASAAYVQRAGADFEAPADGYVMAYCDGAVNMAVGEEASATVGHDVPSGNVYWASIVAGQKVSVIDQ